MPGLTVTQSAVPEQRFRDRASIKSNTGLPR